MRPSWLICLLAVGGFQAAAQSAPDVESALPAAKGTVEFPPLRELAWPEIAGAAMGWLNRPTAQQVAEVRKKLPDPATIQYEDPDTAILSFSAPVDSMTAKGFYYLVTPAGVFRLQPVSLVGYADVKFDPDHQAITGVRFRGSVIGRVRGGPSEQGGIVLRTAAPASISGQTPASPALFKHLPAEDKAEDVSKAYIFRFNGVQYLYVTWKGFPQDIRAYCSNEYGLYTLGTDLQLVRNVAFFCDP